MRPLEIVLIVATLPILFFPYKRYANFGRMLALVLAILLILHIVIEAARWQMIPLYLVAIIWISLAMLGLGLTTWGNRISVGAGVVAILLALGLGLLLPIVQPAPLSGEYAVGTATYHLMTGRPEIFSAEPDDTRQLMLQVWYPAIVTNQPKADYLPNINIGAPAIAKIFSLPFFLLNHVNLIQPNARVEPPVAPNEGGYPLLFFSHGRSGTRVQNTQLVEELASHGYIVAALDHTYGAGYTVFPNGTSILYDHSIFGDDSPEQAGRVVTEWVRDFQFALNTFEAIEPDSGQLLANAINFDQIGIFGHSTGGGAAYEFCFRDDRCKAALGLDPWVVPTSTDAVTQGLPRPAMVIKQDRPLGEISDARLNLLFAQTNQPTYYLQITDARHYDFTDFKRLSPALSWINQTGTIDGERMRLVLNEYTRAFFDHHLRGWQGAILFAESAEFPEVTLREVISNQ